MNSKFPGGSGNQSEWDGNPSLPSVDPTTYRSLDDEISDEEYDPTPMNEGDKRWTQEQSRPFHGKEPSRNARGGEEHIRCPKCGHEFDDESEEVLRKAEGTGRSFPPPPTPGARIHGISAPTASGLTGYKKPAKRTSDIEAAFRPSVGEGQGGRVPKARLELVDPSNPKVRCRRQEVGLAQVARALSIQPEDAFRQLSRGHSLAHPDIPSAFYRMARPTKVVASTEGIREHLAGIVAKKKPPKGPRPDEVNLGGDPQGDKWWDPTLGIRPNSNGTPIREGRFDKHFGGRPAKKGTKKAVEG